MFGYEHIESDILKLTAKAHDITNRAFKENRDLSKDERELVSAMLDKVENLKNGLPVGPPLTMQNTLGGGSYQSGSGFKNLGEQIQAIARASIPGGEVDHRLHQINAAATGLNETVPSDGSFLVQSDFSNDLLTSVFQTNTLPAMCRRIEIGPNSNGLKINGLDEASRATGSRAGGVRSYWLAEAAQATASKPKFRQVELNLKKQVVLVYATDELLQDSTALENVIRDTAISELNFQLADAICNGTGAGQPLGILNSKCLVSVDKETGQKAATIVAENVIKMYARHLPSANPHNVWLVNRNTLPQLYTMSLAVGTGGAPIFQPAGGLSGSPYNTLLGIPVVPIEQCQTLGTVGDIILADMQSYLLATKGGVQAAMSIHVKFDYDESVFRFIMRVDGCPSLASSIVPYKGSETVSPFVALATRS